MIDCILTPLSSSDIQSTVRRGVCVCVCAGVYDCETLV